MTPSPGIKEVDGAVQPCPLTECAALVYCIDGRNYAVKDIYAEIVGVGGTKATDKQGTAEFLHLKPPNQNYTAKVTLKDKNLKNYMWAATDQASTETTQHINAADEELYKFRLLALARPQVQVLWEADNKAIENVGVKLQQGDADKYTLSTTDKTGLSKLGEDDRGVKPDGYQVAFPTGIEHCEVVEGLGITIDEGGTETYLFHVKKFFVSFQLTDQFDKEVTGLDWLLRHGEDKLKETGKLADDDKGLVRKDQVPNGEYKFAVKLVFEPSWESKKLETGTAVKLKVNATGFDPATDVTFEIFDSSVITGAALDTVTGKTPDDPDDHVVEVSWTPDAEKLKKVTSGAVVFVASAGGQKAMSSAAAIWAKQTFDVTDADGNPLTTKLRFSFAGGGKVSKKSAESTNGKAEVSVRLGSTLLHVQLADKKGSAAKFTDSDNNSRNFIVS